MIEGSETLVVGGDSLIGAALTKSLSQQGQSVIATTRREESCSPSRPLLDLADPRLKDALVERTGTAIICAGISNMAACENDPAETARINVTGICSVAKRLLAAGRQVIYLSTSQVFDGSHQAPLPGHPISSNTEYGRQRVAVERFLAHWPEMTKIIRLTKVIESCFPLFTHWIDVLKGEEKVHPYANFHLSPLPLSGVCDAVGGLLANEEAGLFHLAAEREIDYAYAAAICAKSINAPLRLVEPLPAPAGHPGAKHLGGSWQTFDPRRVVADAISALVSEHGKI